jgi:hypothetical protein
VLISPAGLTTQAPPGSNSLLWGAMYALAPPQRVARLGGRAVYAIFRTLYLAFTREDRRMPDCYYQLAAATGAAGAGQGDVLVARLMALRFVEEEGRRRLASWWRAPVLGLLMELERGGATPVSVVWGEEDEILPFLQWAPLLRRALPDSAIYAIKGALHNPAHSDPEAVSASLVDCLRRGAKHAATAAAAAGSLATPQRMGGLFPCTACGAAVVQTRSLFECGCSRFGFASFGLDADADKRQWDAFCNFLEEGRGGTFNAKTSASVVMRL